MTGLRAYPNNPLAEASSLAYYDPHLLQDVSFIFTALTLGTYRLDFILHYHEDLWLVGYF